jgi:hypothetical protein
LEIEKRKKQRMELKQRMEDQPENASAACDYAKALLATDMARACVKYCDMAIKSQPGFSRAYLLKGEQRLSFCVVPNNVKINYVCR